MPDATAAIANETETETETLSRKDIAYDHFHARLVTDGYMPGELIDEEAAARTLGMSRTPVREALLKLETEGMVKVLPRRGIRVVPITRDDMVEVLTLLSSLELTALRLITEQPLETRRTHEFADLTRALQSTLEAKDREAWLLADEAFHCALFRLGGNRHLMETGLRYRNLIRRGHFAASRLLPWEHHQRSSTRHIALLHQIQSDDAHSALDAHAKQKSDGARAILDALSEHKITRL